MKEAIILSYKTRYSICIHEQIYFWFCRKLFQTSFSNRDDNKFKKKG